MELSLHTPILNDISEGCTDVYLSEVERYVGIVGIINVRLFFASNWMREPAGASTPFLLNPNLHFLVGRRGMTNGQGILKIWVLIVGDFKCFLVERLRERKRSVRAY